MERLRERLVSLPLLIAASLAGLLCELGLVFPLSSFIRESSTDISHNFQLTLAYTLLVGLVSGVWLALCIRALWGEAALWPRPHQSGTSAEQEFFAGVKHMRATTTKKAILFVVIVGLQMVSLDRLAQGALVMNTKVNMILTGLRSNEARDRERVLDDAVLMGPNPLITAALGRVMSEPGSARHWAAWAAGVRRDASLTPQLLALSESDAPDEVASSITALSRLACVCAVSAAQKALPRIKERRGDLLVAIGDLGKRLLDEHPKERAEAVELLRSIAFRTSVAPVERHLALWALGRIEAAEVLPQLEELLTSSTSVDTLCVASSALANIGAADTSPKLLSLCWTVGSQPNCPASVFLDYSGRETLLSEAKPLQVRLLTDVALIGDRRAVPELERMATSPQIHPRAQGVAKEIAYAMRIAKKR
ncbi:MAG: hypothetical protein MUC50_20265 [Myxococcota bacterium]|jgi:hypothetical protein|nr:hypothetical protein [Myxococcota bacterium]